MLFVPNASSSLAMNYWDNTTAPVVETNGETAAYHPTDYNGDNSTNSWIPASSLELNGEGDNTTLLITTTIPLNNNNNNIITYMKTHSFPYDQHIEENGDYDDYTHNSNNNNNSHLTSSSTIIKTTTTETARTLSHFPITKKSTTTSTIVRDHHHQEPTSPELTPPPTAKHLSHFPSQQHTGDNTHLNMSTSLYASNSSKDQSQQPQGAFVTTTRRLCYPFNVESIYESSTFNNNNNNNNRLSTYYSSINSVNSNQDGSNYMNFPSDAVNGFDVRRTSTNSKSSGLGISQRHFISDDKTSSPAGYSTKKASIKVEENNENLTASQKKDNREQRQFDRDDLNVNEESNQQRQMTDLTSILHQDATTIDDENRGENSILFYFPHNIFLKNLIMP